MCRGRGGNPEEGASELESSISLGTEKGGPDCVCECVCICTEIHSPLIYGVICFSVTTSH